MVDGCKKPNMTIRPRTNRRSRKITLWLIAALPLLALAAASISVWMQWRQEALDHRLIAAIKSYDTEGAVAALDAGATANARDISDAPVTPRDLLVKLWDRLRGVPSQNPPFPGESALLLSYTVHDVHIDGFIDSPSTSREHLIVAALLQHGADPYTHDEHGRTLLHLAAGGGDTSIVRTLLQHRVDPNVRDTRGDVPLHYANAATAWLLLQSGGDVNAADSEGITVLMSKCLSSNDITDAELVLRSGAKVNARDEDGKTALWTAVGFENVNVVRLLLKYGARVRIRPFRESRTMLDFAIKRSCLEDGTVIDSAINRNRTETIGLLEEAYNKEKAHQGEPQ
jgi:ankyrin repeat protein